MDNAQKAIMIGVGLFITIIIISAVLLITNLGTNLINSARGELGSMSTALQGQILSAYDAQMLSGSEVIGALQQYENSNSLCIVVENGNDRFYTGAMMLETTNTARGVYGGISENINEVTKTFGASSSDGGSRTAMITMTNKQTGINTSATYQSTIVKDTNSKKIIGLIFTLQS